MRFAYFPGCSLHGTAKEYDLSTRLAFDRVGVELWELPGWNCCGATAMAAASGLASLAVPARNLALAESFGLDLVAACNCCFMTLRRALAAHQSGGRTRELIDQSLAAAGKKLSGRLKVRHILDVLMYEVGLAEVERLVSRPLTGLKAVPYYGCQIARPKNEYFGPEFPEELDGLLRVLGLEVPRFDHKTKCCGGALITTKTALALKMNDELLGEAQERGADFIVVTCPMCQMNLEAYQGNINRRFGRRYRMPVLYFTQVLGLAFGIPAGRLGLERHLVPAPRALLAAGGEKA